MKNRIIVLAFFFSFLTFSVYCQEEKSKKQIKKEEKLKNFEALQALVDSSGFIFHAQRAFPQGGKTIDLTTNPGTLKIMGDTVIASLPYFGRSHSGGYSNTDGGMNFTGVMEDVKVSLNEKKYKISYNFTVKDSGNKYQCYIDLSTVNNVNVSITTTNRSSISYSGRVVKFE